MTVASKKLSRDHVRYVGALSFDPTSRFLTYVGRTTDSARILTWDVETGVLLEESPASSGFGQSVAYHPHEELVVRGGSEGAVILKSRSGELVEHLEGLPYPWVNELHFSHDGRYLVAGTGAYDCEMEDCELAVWEFESRRRLNLSVPALSATVSIDGKRLFAGLRDELLSVYDLETGEKLRTYGQLNIARVYDLNEDDVAAQVHVSCDERYAAWMPKGATLVLWDLHKDALVFSEDYTSNILGFSADGRYLLVYSQDAYASWYKFVMNDCSRPAEVAQRDWDRSVQSTVWSPDERWVAVVDSHGVVFLAEAPNRDSQVLWSREH